MEIKDVISAVLQVKEMNLNTVYVRVCEVRRPGSFLEENSLWHDNHQYSVKELEWVCNVGRKPFGVFSKKKMSKMVL